MGWGARARGGTLQSDAPEKSVLPWMCRQRTWLGSGFGLGFELGFGFGVELGLGLGFGLGFGLRLELLVEPELRHAQLR